VGLLVVVGAGIAVGLGGFPRTAYDVVAPSVEPPVYLPASGQPTAAPTAELGDRIRIERLGIDLPVIEGDGLDAPLDSAAHYPGTGWPGDGTNIYLYAHARAGLFDRLSEAQVGDRVVFILADGSLHIYEVGRIIPAAPWDAVDYLDETAAEQLTLQTSTSEVATDPRFIVIAYPTT
jgi:LPXTG-site transpeptidase (sortase) family protein